MDPAMEYIKFSEDMRRVLFFLLISQRVVSQDNDYANWLSMQVRVELLNKWEWHNDAGYRSAGLDWRASQFLYRTGIRYSLSDKHSVMAGVALFYTSLHGENEYRVYEEERRIWQEYAFETSRKKWQFQGRFRTEERFFQAVSNRSARYVTRFRLRANAIRYFNEQWGIQLASEYMYQVDQGTGKFNQYRLAVSGMYRTKGNWQFQFGYMALQWPNRLQHTIIFSVQTKIRNNDH